MPLNAETLLDALPIGVAVIDPRQCIVIMNAAFHASLGLPPNSFPPGTRVEDAVRASAHRGVYGPGDPEAHVAAVMAADRGIPGRLRRRVFDNRVFDLFNTPLVDGGYIVTAIETTAQIRARDEAERAVTQTAIALSAVAVGMAAFRPDGALLFANPRFAELLGLPHERLTPGLGFAVLLAVMESRDEYAGADGLRFVTTQRHRNRSQPSVERRRRGNGQVIDVASAPLPDGGWVMTVTDISPLSQAEHEARQRARLLDSILEAVPHGICVYSADHRVTMFNQTYGKVMAGAPVRVGDTMLDVVRRRAEAGEYGPGVVDNVFAEQMAFDITRPQMRRRFRPDGTAIDVRTAPLPDGGHISVVTDITPLVEAQAETARKAEEMAVMLANIRHGILLWSADRRLVASNTVASELLGYPPDLLAPGRAEDELLENMRQRGEWGSPEQSDKVFRDVRALDRSTSHVREIVMRGGRVLEARSDPIPGGGWVSTFTDITEARAVEAELRHARDKAEAADRAKSRFLATMSHELRTPLNAVIGFSDELLRAAGPIDAEQVRDYAQQINDGGRHLLNLINLILDVARIEGVREELGSDQVDVARLARGVARSFEPAAEAAGLILTVDIPDGMPLLRSDERRLQQALSQLVSNAVKFTDAGGSVTLRASIDGDGCFVIEVRDTGIGIAHADIDRVFEPFTQGDASLARRRQGAGLGLFIARALIDAHGGQLRLRSAPGQGTVAEITLPAARVIQ
jgi:signal transduction histidine kinase